MLELETAQPRQWRQAAGRGHEAFVRGLAVGLPWVQAERLEVGDQSPPRVGVVVRAYFRNEESVAPAPEDGT